MQDRLRAAHQIWAIALQHPDVVPLLTTRPLATRLGLIPSGHCAHALVPDLLAEAGFAPADALQVHHLCFGLLLDTCSPTVEGGHQLGRGRARSATGPAPAAAPGATTIKGQWHHRDPSDDYSQTAGQRTLLLTSATLHDQALLKTAITGFKHS